MKKLILLLVLSLVLSTSIAGVDNMEQRQPGQAPVEQKDHSDDDDDKGGHHGGNHNAPFKSFDILLISFMIIVVYGIYHLRDEHKKT